MNISRKLEILAGSAVAALIVVGGIGLYVDRSLEHSIHYAHETTIPGIKTGYELKSYSQVLAINMLKHTLSDKIEQMQALEKEIDAAQTGMRQSFDKYEKIATTDRERELLKAERAAAEDYFSKLPVILEKDRANDKVGAFSYAPAMGEARVKLAKLIDDHIALNDQYAEAQAAEAKASAQSGMVTAITLILFAIGIIGALGFIVIRGINGSIDTIQQAVARIEGNLDFTVRASIQGNDEISTVSASLNRLFEKLRGNLLSIADNASHVANAAAELASTSEELAKASSLQSDSASNMAANIEEMTVSINHVSDRSTETHTLSVESGKLAVEGESVIGRTVEEINKIAQSVSHASTRIQELDASSAQISSIVSVINDVADQTNLLALNAAIEAARAGEQGRGFAVVADEVRKLAERTATSTKEIAGMINSIRAVSREAVVCMTEAVGLVESGVTQANGANVTIKQIGHGSQETVGMVEEISTAIREQSQASTAIATNVEKIAQMAEESSASAQSSADSARRLDQLAKSMREVVSHYKL